MSSKLKIKNELVSEFHSREHLLECLVASCLVPGWAGHKSRVINGKKYVDGGLTMNLPNLYPNQTIRIQPFSTSETQAEISPFLTNEKDKNKLILKMATDISKSLVGITRYKKIWFFDGNKSIIEISIIRSMWNLYILSQRWKPTSNRGTSSISWWWKMVWWLIQWRRQWCEFILWKKIVNSLLDYGFDWFARKIFSLYMTIFGTFRME